jgi:hypothetical protein
MTPLGLALALLDGDAFAGSPAVDQADLITRSAGVLGFYREARADPRCDSFFSHSSAEELAAIDQVLATKQAASGPPGQIAFRTATGNISCYVSSISGVSQARCDIQQADWAPPPKPSSCQYDWGSALSVNPQGANFSCVSDSAYNDNVVPYGSVQTRGDVSCHVDQAGVTCTDVNTAHGFFLSRAVYRLF